MLTTVSANYVFIQPATEFNLKNWFTLLMSDDFTCQGESLVYQWVPVTKLSTNAFS